ncbi:MAG TPA: nucleotidyltransferase domain-containing protein [Clostridiaceae bacterium]|nr:nucleotidyltransferase domain-containing protein [Clostridiaceae bacterium]
MSESENLNIKSENVNININELIAKLKSYFERKPCVCVVYLYGSTVKGKRRQKSDIDLGILFYEGIDSIQRFDQKLDIRNELEDLVGTEVDIVDLEEADPYFIHNLLLNKVLVVEKDINRRVEFEVKSRREYFDMLPFYRLYHTQAMKRLERR